MEPTTTDRSALEGKVLPELQKIAGDLGIQGSQRLRKAGLIAAIVPRAGGTGPAPGAATAEPPATGDGLATAATSVDGEAPRDTAGNGGVAVDQRAPSNGG